MKLCGTAECLSSVISENTAYPFAGVDVLMKSLEKAQTENLTTQSNAPQKHIVPIH